MAPIIRVSRYPPKPLPPDLRNLLISGLLSTSAVQNLNSTLIASCQVTGWLDAVRDRAIQLLNSGKCNTYAQVMAALQEETKESWIEKTVAESRFSGAFGNGDIASGGKNRFADPHRPENLARSRNGVHVREEKVDVTVPEKVIEDGKRFVKEALDQIVVVENVQ